MYNPQEISNRIKATAKSKNIALKMMLSDCELGINLISHLAKGQAITYINLAKIADYLDCSVDYLLGRTDEPNTIVGNSIKISNIHGDNNANNVSINSEPLDEETLELAKMIKKLSLVNRSKVILFIDELKGK